MLVTAVVGGALRGLFGPEHVEPAAWVHSIVRLPIGLASGEAEPATSYCMHAVGSLVLVEPALYVF